MTHYDVASFAAGAWLAPGAGARTITSAITGGVIGQAGNDALDHGAMLEWARDKGGPALRAMGFHDRARMLKALAAYLDTRKEELYELAFETGATRSDSAVDIDGGIGTVFVFASKGRREMPDGDVYLDGAVEQLSRDGSFVGQHVATPLKGVALHINAFNFPVWGMLEKLAPTLLAGMPAIVKPATQTSYVTEACVRMMLDSGVLPEGALQMIAGGTGRMLDMLGAQDVVSFTGSAATAGKLRATPNLLENSVRFMAEQDSLNAAILGPDATPDTPEFELFVKEVTREMTVKAGQKCTAVRRIIAPQELVDPLLAALSARLDKITIGDPRAKETRMGALVSEQQRADVCDAAGKLGAEAELVYGSPDTRPTGAGAFLAPMLFLARDPDNGARIHDTEAFGPVSTIMPSRDLDHALELANRGGGALVSSIFTRSGEVARAAVLASAAWHGRLYFNNRDSAKASTGHGSPLPHMVHGGPGRAGGGEELGGIRGVLHYMQRTAIQGSPDLLTAIGGIYVPGATQSEGPAHPFTRRYYELAIGETLRAGPREITLADIETFAHFTGDTFYAHMDEDAAKRNPFFPGRVAHGYLLLSFAAGMFVEPGEGPVLANTGLDNLRFLEPVSPGDKVSVTLTVKRKTRRTEEYGEVRWHVALTKEDGAEAATYELMTMNAY